MNKISEWTGKWDEKMEKEISEAAEAELRFNEAEKSSRSGSGNGDYEKK